MRFLIILLFLSSEVFAQKANTILVEVFSTNHYEVTVSGLHKTVDKISLTSLAQVQKFTGIESQPEINLSSQPDWYRIWFYDGSDPYTKEGSVDRIDFHFSSGKNNFTMTPIAPKQQATIDTVLQVKAVYDPSPVLPEKLDPSLKDKPNITPPVGIIYIDIPAPDPKTDNPP